MTVTPTAPTTTTPALPGPAPVGDENIEWALWLTGTGEQRPMRDHITALLTAAQHTARATLHDTGHQGGQVDRAVVLHRGRVWSPEPHTVSGAVKPVLLWSARCTVCGEPFDEEYGHHSTVGEVIEQAVDGDWTDLDGRLICDAQDRDHDAARTTGPQPTAPIPGQHPLPGIPADGPTHTWFGLTYVQLAAAGVRVERHGEDGAELDEPRYTDRDGQELPGHEYVLLPGTDPVPHYNRGRITPYGRRTTTPGA